MRDDPVPKSHFGTISYGAHPETYHIAAADLWKEAEFLSALKHPHIIALRAKHLSFETMDENFIVIERLNQTLQQKITEWREEGSTRSQFN
jgi:hypothetical protein